MFKKMYILIILLALAFSLSACDKDDDADIVQPGLANPASVYCQGLGYTEETRMGDGGEYGVCVFPDGSECDSWAFLGGACGQEYSYCLQQGYTLQSSEDSNIATCVFKDGSTCPEYDYQQGLCQPGDNK